MKTNYLYVYVENRNLCDASCVHYRPEFNFARCAKFEKYIYVTQDKKDKCTEYQQISVSEQPPLTQQ